MPELRCGVAVIGAGITGLVLAHRLHRAGVDVRLFDRADRPGGTVRSERWEGCQLEAGPFSVMPRSPEFAGLIRELGLTTRPGSPDARRGRFVQVRGRLRQVPHGPLGLLTTDLLTWRGKAGLLRRIVRSSPPPPDGPPTTLHAFATRRLGPEPADRVVGPAAVGVFGAEADDLLLESCVPKIAEADRAAGSLIGLIRHVRRASSPQPTHTNPTDAEAPPLRGLVTFPDGLEALPQALASSLGDRLHLGAAAEPVSLEAGRAVFATPDARVSAERVVLATDPRSAVHRLRGLLPDLPAHLRPVRFCSLAVVHLLFREADLPQRPRGFGFLVARGEPALAPVLGVQIPGDVFPWQVPADQVLLRAVVGGPRHPDALDVDDPSLADATAAAIGHALRVAQPPLAARVTRWPEALPIYDRAHAQAASAVARQIEAQPAVRCVTTLHGGIGINDRIVCAERAAQALLSELSERGG